MISLTEFKELVKADDTLKSKLNKMLADKLPEDKLKYAVNYALGEETREFVDEEFARWASNHNRVWNDSNIFCDSSVNSLSNCCRLKSNIEDLGYFNSIGGTALKVGSVKVSTLNLARLAYESRGSETKYLNKLRDRLGYNLEALDIVRDIIKKNVSRNLLPNFNEGMIDFDHLYNTVGINGIYETMKFFKYTEVDEFGNTKYTDKAFQFGEKILSTIREVSEEFAKGKDYKINMEQVPGEQAAIKFLQADRLLFGEKTVDVKHTYSYNFYEFDLNNKHYRVPEIDMFEVKNDNNELIMANIKRVIDEGLDIKDDVLSKYIC